MANLTVDIGNSSAKLVVFEDDTIVETYSCPHLAPADLALPIQKYGIKKSILSSVAQQNFAVLDYLGSHTDFIELTSETPVPLTIDYETPKTLGHDRIASAVGAMVLKPNSNALIMDIGTCNTYDFISENHSFRGGNITPGFEMRLKAMHAFTGKLPQVKTTDCNLLLGKSTETALQCGAFWGIVYEMDGIIDDLKRTYPDISVFLTGGYAFYFEKRIKNRIFAVPNLVSIGLNKILMYNDSL